MRAAAERFRTRGFAATSLDDLAEATGLARPSLYAAFGDKRAMYLTALDAVVEWLNGAFATLAERDLPMPELLKAIFLPTIDLFVGGEMGPSGCIVINTAAVEAVTDAEIRDRLAGVIALEDQGIAALLARAGSPMPEAHGRLVTSAIHSLSVRARAGTPRAALIDHAKEISALIAASVSPR